MTYEYNSMSDRIHKRELQSPTNFLPFHHHFHVGSWENEKHNSFWYLTTSECFFILMVLNDHNSIAILRKYENERERRGMGKLIEFFQTGITKIDMAKFFLRNHMEIFILFFYTYYILYLTIWTYHFLHWNMCLPFPNPNVYDVALVRKWAMTIIEILSYSLFWYLGWYSVYFYFTFIYTKFLLYRLCYIFCWYIIKIGALKL